MLNKTKKQEMEQGEIEAMLITIQNIYWGTMSNKIDKNKIYNKFGAEYLADNKTF
jgi:hypothetical protein